MVIKTSGTHKWYSFNWKALRNEEKIKQGIKSYSTILEIEYNFFSSSSYLSLEMYAPAKDITVILIIDAIISEGMLYI